GELRQLPQFAEFHDLLEIALVHPAAHQFAEFHSPGVRRDFLRAAAHHRQVVHELAAAEDEHATLAQEGEFAAELEVLLRRHAVVDAELDHRDVGGWVHVREYGPGAV